MSYFFITFKVKLVKTLFGIDANSCLNSINFVFLSVCLIQFSFPRKTSRQSLFHKHWLTSMSTLQKPIFSVCVCVFEHSCVGDPPNHKPSQLSELWFFFVFSRGPHLCGLHVAHPIYQTSSSSLSIAVSPTNGTKNTLLGYTRLISMVTRWELHDNIALKLQKVRIY